MDFLRDCYYSRMRLYRDRPDISVPGRWRWCPPGARIIPYAHAFASFTQDEGERPKDPPVGEIPQKNGRTRGESSPRFTGQHFCGSEQDWTQGALYSERGNIPVDEDGVPLCCDALPELPGGPVFDGAVDQPADPSGGGLLLGGGTVDRVSRTGGGLLLGAGLVPFAGGGLLLGGGAKPEVEESGGGLLLGGGSVRTERSGGGLLLGGGEHGCVGLTTVCTPAFLTRTLIADVVGTGASAGYSGAYTLNLNSIVLARWETSAAVESARALVVEMMCVGTDWTVVAIPTAGPVLSTSVTWTGTRPAHFTTAVADPFGPGGELSVTIREPSTCIAVPAGGGLLLGAETRTPDRSSGGLLLGAGQYIRPAGGGLVLSGGHTRDTLPTGGGLVLSGGHTRDTLPTGGGLVLSGGVPLGGLTTGGGLLLSGGTDDPDLLGGGLLLSGSSDLGGDSPATTCSPATMKRQMWATVRSLGGTVPAGSYPFLLDESSMIWSVPAPFLPANIVQFRFFCAGGGLWFWDALDDVSTPWGNFIASWTGPPYVGAESTDVDVTSPYYPGIWGVTFFQGES